MDRGGAHLSYMELNAVAGMKEGEICSTQTDAELPAKIIVIAKIMMKI